MLKSLFSKVAGLRASKFIKKRLQSSSFPVTFAKFLRIPTLKNICEQLLLKFITKPSLTNTSIIPMLPSVL